MRAHRFSQSSVIDYIIYDAAARTLRISFRETGRYVYDGVPEAVVEDFCKARSAGTFFNTCIKDKYRVRRDPDRRRFGPNI